MESNSLLLGRIPGSGTGIRKSYEESFFVEDRSNDSLCYVKTEDKRDRYGGLITKGKYEYSGDKFYFNKRTDKLIKSSNIEDESIYDKEDYKELVILSIYPYTVGTSLYYLYEVIEKDILHKHLLDEKMLLEDIRQSLEFIRQNNMSLVMGENHGK